MESILINAFSLIFIIFIGNMFKRMTILTKEDGRTLSKIILNITLPAAIIMGLKGVVLEPIHFLFILLGIIANLGIAIFILLTRKSDPPLVKAFMLYNTSGYNIGNFTLVFLQSFFPLAIPFLCVFDIGNALMMFGGTKVIVNKSTQLGDSDTDLKSVLKRLLHSVPFMTYIILFLLKMFHIEFSDNIYLVVGKFAGANSFLSMFMIGLFLELHLEKRDFKLVSKTLLLRYSYNIVFSLVVFFFFPASAMIRQVLVLILLSPIATITTLHTIDAGEKEETAGFISSSSILISLVLMILFLVLVIN